MAQNSVPQTLTVSKNKTEKFFQPIAMMQRNLLRTPFGSINTGKANDTKSRVRDRTKFGLYRDGGISRAENITTEYFGLRQA